MKGKLRKRGTDKSNIKTRKKYINIKVDVFLIVTCDIKYYTKERITILNVK